MKLKPSIIDAAIDRAVDKCIDIEDKVQKEFMTQATEIISSTDLSVADRFIECCYNDDLCSPTATQMARLVALGLVEVVKPGGYGETDKLRQALDHQSV